MQKMYLLTFSVMIPNCFRYLCSVSILTFIMLFFLSCLLIMLNYLPVFMSSSPLPVSSEFMFSANSPSSLPASTPESAFSCIALRIIAALSEPFLVLSEAIARNSSGTFVLASPFFNQYAPVEGLNKIVADIFGAAGICAVSSSSVGAKDGTSPLISFAVGSFSSGELSSSDGFSQASACGSSSVSASSSFSFTALAGATVLALSVAIFVGLPDSTSFDASADFFLISSQLPSLGAGAFVFLSSATLPSMCFFASAA